MSTKKLKQKLDSQKISRERAEETEIVK